MVYLLRGEITVRERPERYLGKFLAIDERRQPHQLPGLLPPPVRTSSIDGLVRKTEMFRMQRQVSITRNGVRRDVSTYIVASPIDAFELGKAGYEVVQIKSGADAEVLCEEKTVNVASRLFMAPPSWINYIARMTRVRDHDTITGEVLVWDVTRFPLPILSLGSRGKLRSIFTVFPDGVVGPEYQHYEGRTLVKTKITGSGKYVGLGPTLDLGFLTLSAENPRTSTNIQREIVRYR